MKRLYALLLALILTLPLIAETVTIDGLNYSTNSDGTCTLTGYSGDKPTGSLTIPSTIQSGDTEYTVTTIGTRAFVNCSALNFVTISDAVTSIGEYAFSNCTALPSITIPNSVTKIGRRAFYNCSALTSVTISNSVTSIGESAFYLCSALTSITIPASVTEIDDYAFSGCISIKEVTIEDGAKTLTLGENGSYYGLFDPCPIEKLYLGRILSYDVSPFQKKSTLTTLTIGDKVTTIGSSAFRGCSSLKSVTIPASVTEIGNSAFDDCTSITEVTLEDGIETLKVGYYDRSQGLFYSSPLEKLYLGRTLSYSISPFKNQSKLTAVTVGEKVTAIGKSAFGDCSALTAITIPASVTSIGESAFSYCSALTSVTIPNSVTSISKSAFYRCSALTSVTIPNSVTSIGSSAFRDCSALASVTIPNSVTAIGSSAFLDCSALTSITIPASVTEIGNYAFNGCTAIKEVTLEDGEQELKLGYNDDSYKSELGLFYSCPLEKLYLGRKLSYTVSPFKNLSPLTAVTIGEKVTAIGESAFAGCSALTAVTIPASVIEVDDNAFNNCSALTSVSLPNSITSIGESAFRDCTALTAITIPASVTEIGNYAFNGCTSIKEVTLEDGEQELKLGYNNNSNNIQQQQGLFYSCPLEKLYLGRTLSYSVSPFKDQSKLTAVTIGEKVTSIGPSAFRNCSALASVTIPNSVISIGSSAFDDCSALTSVNIPSSITAIDSYTFRGCSAMASITIPNSVTSIGESAFSDCSALSSITIPASVTEIGNSAFYGCYQLKTVVTTSISNWCSISFSGLSANPLNNDAVLYLNDIPVTSLDIPDDVTVINDYAFHGYCSITELIIPDNVTTIGSSAFKGCKNLKKVILGSGITEIGGSAFYGAPIYDINTSMSTPPAYGSNSFSSETFSNAIVKVPSGALDLYKQQWSDFRYLFAENSVDKEFVIETPGALLGLVNTAEVITITSLKLIGKINGTDLLTMNKMINLMSLDLSEATIVSGGMPYYEADNKKFGTQNDSLNNFWSYNLPLLTDIKLPENLKHIGESAITDKLHLKEIRIPASVSEIDRNAFSGCKNLEKVVTPSIDAWCRIKFGNRSSNPISYAGNLYAGDKIVSKLHLPDTLTTINDYAFVNCSSIESIIYPVSLVTIGESAFYGCSSIVSISIPSEVKDIKYHAFEDCSSLMTLTLEDGTSSVKISSDAFSECPLTTIHHGRTISDDSAPFCDMKSLSALTIGNNVTSINANAFKGCSSLKSISIPPSVTSIGNKAFVECSSLSDVTIEDGSKTLTIGNNDVYKLIYSYGSYKDGYWIQYGLFSDCPLKTIHVGRNLYYRSNSDSSTISPFDGKTGVSSLTIGDSVTVISHNEFAGLLNVTSVTIPNSVMKIDYAAFSGCTGLSSIIIPNSVTEIGSSSFKDCTGLTSVIIPNSVTSIGASSFEDCTGLTEITLSTSLKKIPDDAFRNCSSLEKISIPDPVISIGNGTFYGCSALKEITLPGSLREIGQGSYSSDNTFSGCTSLTDVYVINPVPPVIQEGTFPASVTAAATLHVPEGSEGINWIHPYWGKFANIENWIVGTQSEFVAENVTYHITSEADATVEISAAALTGSRAGGIALTIPASVTFNGKTYRVAGIANNGFENCAVESVELPATIGYVGLEAFKGCANLTALSVKAELPPSADVSSFDEAAYTTVKLSVPESSKDAYSAHAVWGKFSLESIPNNPTDPENPDDGTDAIENIAGDTDISVSVESGAIIVTAPEGTPIEVYGMSGACVRSTREHRIDGLTRGVYIVRIGARTFKVAI